MDTICEPSLFNERTRGFTARVIAFATPPVHPRDHTCCARNVVLSWSPDSFPQVETIVSTKEEYKAEFIRGSAESLATTDDILKIEWKPSSTLVHRPAPASASRPQALPPMANGGLISEPRLPPDITNAEPRYKNNHPIALELTGEVDGVNLSEMSMVQVQNWCKMKKQQNSSWTRKWGCRYCEDHGEPRKLWCAPRFITSHWRDECKYNPRRETIPMKESLAGTMKMIKSQSEGVSWHSDNRSSKITSSPMISPSETAISSRHTPPPDTDRILLGRGKFGCRECDRHEDKGIVGFPTYDAAYTHFRTECKYGPSFRGSWPKSTLSIQIGSQTFGFRAPSPPPKVSDALDDEWFYDRYRCYPKDYPVAVELIDISVTSPLEPKWICRHCREYGEPREKPLRTWNKQGWVLNHWTYCKYNRQRQIGRGQGRYPVVMSRSQVCTKTCGTC